MALDVGKCGISEEVEVVVVNGLIVPLMQLHTSGNVGIGTTIH